MQPKYNELLLDDDVRRWFENLRARSVITATVYLRGLGYYCYLNNTNLKEILANAKSNEQEFKDNFIDFIRRLEKGARQDHT